MVINVCNMLNINGKKAKSSKELKPRLLRITDFYDNGQNLVRSCLLL